MNRNRRLAYGAMMAAVLSVLLLLNRFTGTVLENFLIYLYPMPVLIYNAKFGGKSGTIVFMAMLIMAFLLSTPSSFVIAGGQMLVGFICGACVHRHCNKHLVMALTIVFSMIFTFLQMIVFARFFGYDNEAEIIALEQYFQSLLEKFHTSLPAGFNIHVHMIRILYISVLLTGSVDGMIIYFLAKLLLKRLRIDNDS